MENPTFESFRLRPELKLVLAELGLTRPTPIQSASIPALLEGRDLIGQSKTGSGKTLAFTLPTLQRLDLKKSRPQALVLSPTRELSQQVAREIRRLGRRLPQLKVIPLVGGQPFGGQRKSLQGGAHILVGTPGRVLDHLRRGTVDFRDISLLVLDEADRMLDMGFEEEMASLLEALPNDRQTILFSATFPASIADLSAAYQHDPVEVRIAEEQVKPDIRQVMYEVNEEEKISATMALLRQHAPQSAIIFCHLKLKVADLAEELSQAGFSAASLHGDLDQTDRDRVMALFRNRSLKILVATDVAARGIDVLDLDLVINFDLPKPDIYLHRIGRTGRAGKSGLALSLATPGEKYKVKGLAEAGAAIEHAELDFATAPGSDEENVEAAPSEAPMQTLFIGGGRKDKVRPGDILGALTGEAGGLSGKDVGKIEIHDRFSYVAVSRPLAETALNRLRLGKIKGRKFRVEMVQ